MSNIEMLIAHDRQQQMRINSDPYAQVYDIAPTRSQERVGAV
jgi:hypothetical protein